jgi:tryptophan synthase alpha subunit
MAQEVESPDKPLASSRTMANASAAGAVGTVLLIAPAIEPAGQVVEMVQKNPQGFLYVVAVGFIIFALVAAYLRWDDKRRAV